MEQALQQPTSKMMKSSMADRESEMGNGKLRCSRFLTCFYEKNDVQFCPNAVKPGSGMLSINL